MAFITATRLVQYGDLIGGVQTPITPTVFRTFNNQVVQDVPAAVALVTPANQRPAVTDYWKYALQWQVDAYGVPHVRGVVAGTRRLVYDADFWGTRAASQAGNPPVARNTFVHEFPSSVITSAVGQGVIAAVNGWLLRAGLAGWTGDLRDSHVVTSTAPADDPLGLLTNPSVVAADGQPVDLVAVWLPVI